MKITNNDLQWVLAFILSIVLFSLPRIIGDSIMYEVKNCENSLSSAGNIIAQIWFCLIVFIGTVGIKKIIEVFIK